MCKSGAAQLAITAAHLALGLCLIALPGCGSADNRLVEETTEEYYPVQPDATISVKNTDGSIRIYGADTDEVKVHATKKAYSAERVQKIAVNVSANPRALAIDTVFPPKAKRRPTFDRSGTVDYSIIVPQTCNISRLELADGELVVEGIRGPGVKGSLINGRLVSHNCFANLQFSVVNGGLDLFYDWWEKRRIAIDLHTVTGGVRAVLPGDATFKIIAEVQSGQISDAFHPKEQERGGGSKSLNSEVGVNPQTQLTIRSTQGYIKIEEAY
ncbi:MAG: hypothetical protein ABI871_08505 [Chthoniobacterales bacterium]